MIGCDYVSNLIFDTGDVSVSTLVFENQQNCGVDLNSIHLKIELLYFTLLCPFWHSQYSCRIFEKTWMLYLNEKLTIDNV